VFHAQIADESGRFSIEDVLEQINQKLIRRHPHVFGEEVIRSADEQRSHWERLKKEEGKSSILDGVPRILPALYRASRIQQKAASVGFDWERIDQVWDKVEEEIAELKESLNQEDRPGITEEFGDLLFALVNFSRFIDVQPEEALRGAIEKFIHRFHKLEQVMEKEGVDMRDASLEELDAVWDRVK
jgi:MazG family protein